MAYQSLGALPSPLAETEMQYIKLQPIFGFEGVHVIKQ